MMSKQSSRAQATPAPSKRDEILDAATHVFLDRGFEATSMDLVAQASGAARRTLYNQFESKEALFSAMIERIWRDFPALDITSDAQALADPRVGLTRLGEAVADFWAPDQAVALVRMVIAEGVRVPALAERFLEAGKAPAMRAVIGYVRKLTERRLLRVDDPELAAKQFMGMINEPLLWLRLLGVEPARGAQERKRVVEGAVGMFLAHFGQRAPRRRE
jgi:AcrR family transcriptional regulator